EQARRVAAALAGEGIRAVYSSDLRRARQTAEMIAAALGLPVRLDPALRELNLGEWQGLTAPEIEARYPEAHRRWREDSVTHRPPGGETLAALQERALAAVT